MARLGTQHEIHSVVDSLSEDDVFLKYILGRENHIFEAGELPNITDWKACYGFTPYLPTYPLITYPALIDSPSHNVFRFVINLINAIHEITKHFSGYNNEDS